MSKKSIETEFEYLKTFVPFRKIYQAKGNVYLHPFSDKADRKQNIAFAKGFADQHKADLYIKEHLDKNKLIIFNQKYPGIINPDKIKNNEFVLIYNRKKYQGDLATQKSNNTVRVIENAFKNKFGYTKNKTPKQLQSYRQTFLAIDINEANHAKTSIEGVSSAIFNKGKKIKNLKIIILKWRGKYIIIEPDKAKSIEDITHKIRKHL